MSRVTPCDSGDRMTSQKCWWIFGRTCEVPANRQRIVSSRGSFFRHRITPTNVGRNRHWRRRLVSVPAGTAHREQRRGVKTEAGGGAARRASPRQFLRFPASPPAAPRGRRLRSHASQRAPGRREPPSPPPPIEAMRCRSEATKAKRCAVGNNEAMRCRFGASDTAVDGLGGLGLGADRQRIANLFPSAHRFVFVASDRQRIASIGGGGDCCSRYLGARSLSLLGRLRPRGAAGVYAGNRLNGWGNARCAAPPPASVATAQRCSRRAVPARTDISRCRTCRFRPTFVGVMRWRKKDPPELAMRCRIAL